MKNEDRWMDPCFHVVSSLFLPPSLLPASFRNLFKLRRDINLYIMIIDVEMTFPVKEKLLSFF